MGHGTKTGKRPLYAGRRELARKSSARGVVGFGFQPPLFSCVLTTHCVDLTATVCREDRCSRVLDPQRNFCWGGHGFVQAINGVYGGRALVDRTKQLDFLTTMFAPEDFIQRWWWTASAAVSLCSTPFSLVVQKSIFLLVLTLSAGQVVWPWSLEQPLQSR